VTGPLHVAFLWHMHQPYYKDLVADRYVLPWVLLHGTKDYHDMVQVLEGYPGIRQTFNLVPSLLAQIADYAEGRARDGYVDLTLRDAASLSDEEKVRLLTDFFHAHPPTMIQPHPRYRDLLTKRGPDAEPERLARAARYFSAQDLTDLQVWFNLAWVDPTFHRSDPTIRGLVDKGRDFTAADKHALVERQRAILGMIVPAYRAGLERGQVELTTTPFYHPILPLLCDTDVAREALPHAPLPTAFRHPEDAEEQVRRAVRYHTDLFGRAPRGMWPSEGSVSEAILPIAARAGIEWIATDEEVLRASQRLAPPAAGDHFRPYLLERDGTRLSILFRDHRLSDRIGFDYATWDPEDAAADFAAALHRIRRSLGGADRPPLVSLILDGENCWEYYPGDGEDFLHALYRRLEADPDLVCTTVSGHLDDHPPGDRLPRLFAGSWIHHDFEIWIGREEDNLAWERLRETREALAAFAAEPPEGFDPERLRMAWEALYIAEGSDWCWWYGGQHAGMLAEFDALFRRHLMNVYERIGLPVPDALEVPILRQVKEVTPTRPGADFVTPEIDGRVGSYFEWLPAALLDMAAGGGGAMHPAGHRVARLHYGFDAANLYLRLDLMPDAGAPDPERIAFSIHFLAPEEARLDLRLDGGGCAVRRFERADGEWAERPFAGEAAFDEVVELGVPFAAMGWRPGGEVHLFVRVLEDGGERERWPVQGYLAVHLPDADYEAARWYV